MCMLTYEERTIDELQVSANRNWFALMEVNQALHELGLLDEVRHKVAEIAERDFLPERDCVSPNGTEFTRPSCYRLVWVSGCTIESANRIAAPVWHSTDIIEHCEGDA